LNQNTGRSWCQRFAFKSDGLRKYIEGEELYSDKGSGGGGKSGGGGGGGGRGVHACLFYLPPNAS